ncbi:MAG: sulfatase-like hydrolase/transferase [Kiritimatiellaeota bacterium]|nr:sulfatase-like hydrolase/transferase [Kiritimatiellota bacterium]
MENTRRPNILFVMSDSLSPQFMGAYGDTAGSTPNLDALAQGGVLFGRAYCNSPLCAPSRASMATGRHVSDIGAYDNANAFPSDVPTMAHALKRAGYETAIVGKMHFVGHDQHHGFDQRLALAGDYSKGYNPREYSMAYDWSQPSAGNPVGADWMGPSYVYEEKWDHYTHHFDRDEATHAEALRYLGEKTPDNGPFFCCVSYHHPHNPFYIPEKFKAALKKENLPLPKVPADLPACCGVMEKWLREFHHQPARQEAIMARENLQWLYETYYGMVADMDARTGELLALLRARGLGENTAVVFTSDHGDMLGNRGMVQKRCFYEHSARVPMIFSWPGHFQQGARLDTPVSLVDLLPTFAAIAGVEPPDGNAGQSLETSLVRGVEPENRVVFCEYHGEGVHAPCFMAVKNNLKYIYVHGHEELLYDLERDPCEYHDLGADKKYDAAKRELKAALLERFDPDAIAAAAIRSQADRKYILGAHTRP